MNESQVTVTVDDVHKCDECTSEDTCVSCIIAKAKAFELNESVLDEEEHKHNEESLKSIMTKAKAFELEKSFPEEEFLVVEDRNGTLCDYTVVPDSWIKCSLYRTVVWSVVLR